MEVVYSNKECEENENLILTRVHNLRCVLKDKHKIIIPNHCDQFLARCLRLKDGDFEKAVSFVRSYNAAIPYLHSYNAIVQPSQHENLYKSGVLTPLRVTDSFGRRIFIGRLGLWDLEKTSFDQLIIAAWMMSQYLNAESVQTQKIGFITIWDFTGFTLRHVLALKQWKFPYLAKLQHEGIGGRYKAYHVINHPKIANIIYSGMKPFLTEKIKQRVFFHPDNKSLHKHFNCRKLPDYLGGCLSADQSFDMNFIDELLKYDHHFEEMTKHRFPVK